MHRLSLKIPESVCGHCEYYFEDFDLHGDFCSEECAKKDELDFQGMVESECAFCEDLFIKCPSNLEDRFCSKSCEEDSKE